jgi:hypothetical protein
MVVCFFLYHSPILIARTLATLKKSLHGLIHLSIWTNIHILSNHDQMAFMFWLILFSTGCMLAAGSVEVGSYCIEDS